jgi:hypothetical protein
MSFRSLGANAPTVVHVRAVSSLLALLAATIGLAGCFSDGGGLRIDDLEVDGPKPGATFPVDALECRFVVAFVPVAAETVADRIPENFRPLSPAELGLPADPQGDAVLALEAERCAQGVAADGTLLEDVTTGGLWVPALPPENLREPDVDLHLVKLLHVTPDATIRAKLHAKGVAADAGQADFTLPASAAGALGPDMAAFTATLALDEGGTYAWTALGGTDAAIADRFQSYSWLAFMPLMHKSFVKTQADFSATSVLEAVVTVDVPAAGPAYAILGQEQTRGYAVAGVGSYENAVMIFPTEHGGMPEHNDGGH